MSKPLQDTLVRPKEAEFLPRLRPSEAVFFDTAPLVRLFAELGEAVAEDTVCSTLEEISLRLHRLDLDYRAHDIPQLPDGAREITRLAEAIGLATVARVAAMVADCARGKDQAALGATLARLTRAVDRSLAEIWDIPDA